jgi:hypothetical protein
MTHKGTRMIINTVFVGVGGVEHRAVNVYECYEATYYFHLQGISQAIASKT